MEMSQRIIPESLRNIVDALISDVINIFGLALTHFRISIFVILLPLHINSRQFGVEMLNQSPEENIIAILHIKNNLMQVLDLVKRQVVKFKEMPGDEGCPRFSNGVVNSTRMPLILKLHFFIWLV